jgi:hypothetical protein
MILLCNHKRTEFGNSRAYRGPMCASENCQLYGEVEVEVTLRPTVSSPVSLGVRRPSGTSDQFYFLLEMFFRQLRVCNFVAPSLTRGRVCNLLYNYVWALPEQSFLGRSPAELTVIFYCLIWDSPNMESQVPVFISPRNRVAQLYTRALGLRRGNLPQGSYVPSASLRATCRLANRRGSLGHARLAGRLQKTAIQSSVGSTIALVQGVTKDY